MTFYVKRKILLPKISSFLLYELKHNLKSKETPSLNVKYILKYTKIFKRENIFASIRLYKNVLHVFSNHDENKGLIARVFIQEK